MTATLQGGPYTKALTRDEEGHRQYEVSHLVRTNDVDDGPQTVMYTPGLPLVGAWWDFGNDNDAWAYCWPNMRVTIHEEKRGDPTKHWKVSQIFSTKPFARCQDDEIEDPLLEPQRVSGSFTRSRQEMRIRANDDTAIENSAKEILTGPETEFDSGLHTVRIAQNRASLEHSTFSSMMNTVNDDTLWGYPTRCVKLSNVSWEKRQIGICDCFFTRIFDFEINPDTFDNIVPDEGTQVVSGKHGATGWEDENPPDGYTPDVTNPQDIIKYKDWLGQQAKVRLDGSGKPWDGTGTSAPTITIDYYAESDFLTLGIPTDLESC